MTTIKKKLIAFFTSILMLISNQAIAQKVVTVETEGTIPEHYNYGPLQNAKINVIVNYLLTDQNPSETTGYYNVHSYFISVNDGPYEQKFVGQSPSRWPQTYNTATILNSSVTDEFSSSHSFSSFGDSRIYYYAFSLRSENGPFFNSDSIEEIVGKSISDDDFPYAVVWAEDGVEYGYELALFDARLNDAPEDPSTDPTFGIKTNPNGSITVDFRGELRWSTDLSTWNQFDPEVISPYTFWPGDKQKCFYRQF